MTRTTPPITQLDVRPHLARGEEPFGLITETARALPPGACLQLIAPFRPAPLFSVMARMGFSAQPNQRPDGAWEVLFSPDPALAAAPDPDLAPGSAPEAALWPDPAHSLDLTGLNPPEPMTRILSMLQKMQPGQVLFALLDREPVLLFPELAQQGHEWAGNHSPDKASYRLMIRCGLAP